jgi:hypothetical protein
MGDLFNTGAEADINPLWERIRAKGKVDSNDYWEIYGPSPQAGESNYWTTRASELGIPWARETYKLPDKPKQKKYSFTGTGPTGDSYNLQDLVAAFDPQYEYGSNTRSARVARQWYHDVPYGEISKGQPSPTIGGPGELVGGEGGTQTPIPGAKKTTEATPQPGEAPATPLAGSTGSRIENPQGTPQDYGGFQGPANMTAEQELAWIANQYISGGAAGRAGMTPQMFNRYRTLTNQARNAGWKPQSTDWRMMQNLYGAKHVNRDRDTEFYKMVDRFRM